MVVNIIKTRSGMETVPPNWYAGVEKSKDKARRLQGKLVAINNNTSIVIGRLIAVDIDRLWRQNFPYCKVTLQSPQRYRNTGALECNMGENEVFFLNKPEMILSLEELSNFNPGLYTTIHKKIKIDSMALFYGYYADKGSDGEGRAFQMPQVQRQDTDNQRHVHQVDDMPQVQVQEASGEHSQAACQDNLDDGQVWPYLIFSVNRHQKQILYMVST
jgi:hypothetical protein